MSLLLKTELPYDPEPQRLFASVAPRPWSMWLDSGGSGGELGRYDIFVADPYITLVTQGGETRIASSAQSRLSEADPFELLRDTLKPEPHAESDPDIPFAGGAVGYFGYDLARRIESLPEIANDDIGVPEMAIGLYDWAVVFDHQKQRCWLVSHGRQRETRENWPQLVERFSQAQTLQKGEFRATSAIQANMDEEGYARGFERIQHYLLEGDCYQVNFAQRFSVEVTGDPWQGYLQLRRQNPAPFSAYLNTPFGQLLCTSPERFLKLKGRQVETRPIKGTRPRSEDTETDKRLMGELQQSDKDRAENLMIVDLLRNDLGKSCCTGSVRVPKLFAVESFATVHHLVSVIEGQLCEGSDALKLLRDCFPGGSITGAPKLRAMQIIEELEPCRRGIYCGSIGYIGYDGNMDSNIVIRTALHKEDKLYYSAGGGIVRDSECEAEYQETFDKAAAFFYCFQG
ncbi:MAG: aminodeoxychorismate synthase component I [Pseudomonadota bacterium]